jgi:hypothetical protein
LHSFQTIASLHLCFASWWLTRNLVAWLPCSLLSPFSSWPCSSLAGRTIPFSSPGLNTKLFPTRSHQGALKNLAMPCIAVKAINILPNIAPAAVACASQRPIQVASP